VKGPPDPATVVANSSLIAWSGRVWRCHHRSRGALNADGSLGGVGGRFNAGLDSVVKPAFRALYTSVESAAALLEVIRHLGYRAADARAVVALENIAMRTLSQLDVALQRVFDWSHDSTFGGFLTSNTSYPYTQKLAAEASMAGAEAILVPSATGIDANLIIFVENAGAHTQIELVKQITDLRPILRALEEGP
jgi:RES domain-containing protein